MKFYELLHFVCWCTAVNWESYLQQKRLRHRWLVTRWVGFAAIIALNKRLNQLTVRLYSYKPETCGSRSPPPRQSTSHTRIGLYSGRSLLELKFPTRMVSAPGYWVARKPGCLLFWGARLRAVVSKIEFVFVEKHCLFQVQSNTPAHRKYPWKRKICPRSPCARSVVLRCTQLTCDRKSMSQRQRAAGALLVCWVWTVALTKCCRHPPEDFRRCTFVDPFIRNLECTGSK